MIDVAKLIVDFIDEVLGERLVNDQEFFQGDIQTIRFLAAREWKQYKEDTK